MVLCANAHDNLGGLSHCRVCGLPLLNLESEFASLANSLACKAEMGRCSASELLIGLGTIGANLVDTCCTTYNDHGSDYSYLVVDTDRTVSSTESNGLLPLRLSLSRPSAGTFCGIGEAVTRSDPHIMPIFRKAGLSRENDSQVVFILAGIGGGIGSAVSVLIEKCHQLNPNCHSVALVIIPGVDESFHNHLNAYCGLSRLLENGGPQAPDLIVAVNYDRLKALKGIGTSGQELVTDGLLAALSDLLTRNLSTKYIAEVIRINQSMGVRLVVPCVALGRSMEIFGNLTNILESTIAYPANHISRQAVLTCHLLLHIPENQATGFGEEEVNKELWSLVRRHLPGVKATSLSITCSDEKHDRIKACILLGGDSATGALFADDHSYMEFREELDRQVNWQTYGLDEKSMKMASNAVTRYDNALEQIRVRQTIKKTKTRRNHR